MSSISATGLLQDWDSSLTFTKNPNYWAFDEKYPDNRLPYIDVATQDRIRLN